MESEHQRAKQLASASGFAACSAWFGRFGLWGVYSGLCGVERSGDFFGGGPGRLVKCKELTLGFWQLPDWV